MTVRELYLLRHGETHWNAEGRFQGILDSALTETGIAQAQTCGRLLAAKIGHVDTFHASPLGRVRETAAIVRSFGEYPDTRWEPRLREVSLGAWDGLTQIDIDECWPDLLDGSTHFDWYFRSPDGESYEAARERVNEWLDELDGVVVAITHGLLSRILRGAYLGLAKDVALSLPVPQDVIWHLARGSIAALA